MQQLQSKHALLHVQQGHQRELGEIQIVHEYASRNDQGYRFQKRH